MDIQYSNAHGWKKIVAHCRLIDDCGGQSWTVVYISKVVCLKLGVLVHIEQLYTILMHNILRKEEM